MMNHKGQIVNLKIPISILVTCFIPFAVTAVVERMAMFVFMYLTRHIMTLHMSANTK